MFFVLSKILWFLIQPLSIALLLLLLALLLAAFGRRRLSATAVVFAVLVIGVCGYTTTGYLALHPLEARFARPAAPESITGIIVLGGGLDGDINEVRRGYEFDRSGDRYVEALRLALLYPEAKVLISGATGQLVPGQDTEAAAGRRYFLDFGIAPERIIEEGEARNTEENAQLTKASLDPQPGETWLLVTSAFHMPRSVGLFRKAGFDVVPWPADYLTSGAETVGFKWTQVPDNLAVASIAMREWVGLMVYWMTGKIGEILPGPAVSPATQPPA